MKERFLKPRYLIPALAAVLALAAIVPAFGRGTGDSGAQSQHRSQAASVKPGASATSNGTLQLPVEVAGPATVSTDGEVPAGDAKTTTTGTGPDGTAQRIEVSAHYVQAFAATAVTASHAGTVNLPLRLTAAGKKILADGGKTEVVVQVDAAGPGPLVVMNVPVGG
jgi:hypothetical protein